MLNSHFDSVVMLTWSDWWKEPRSNRYHYARMLSCHLPVIFVQPDIHQLSYHYEPTELKDVTILHLSEFYGKMQTEILDSALREKGIIRPLLWIYNFLFIDFIRRQYSPLRVYHATEDYFSKDIFTLDPTIIETLRKVLQDTDLLLSVSAGVQNSYQQQGGYAGRSCVITNGCDYDFWAGEETIDPAGHKKKIMIYQGGINARLDLGLLHQVASALPEWELQLCGRIDTAAHFPRDEWDSLQQLPNVVYLGELRPEELRTALYGATVGLIPFQQNEYIFEKSFPLKAFEYVACGLPVVSVPIKGLLPFSNIFSFARTAEEFAEQTRRAESSRFDMQLIHLRRSEAREKDYLHNFKPFLTELEGIVEGRRTENSNQQLNILILYDQHSLHVPTIREHLDSFSAFSTHKVFYANATRGMKANQPAQCLVDLSIFDVVIIHYSVRLSLTWHLSPSFAAHLRRFSGLKVLFIQDEYDSTHTARNWIKDLGVHVVFTCVPDEFVEVVYAKAELPQVEFIQTLTGFVPLQAEKTLNAKPHHLRKHVIGYRGRALPYWYGLLGQEKLMIGKRMREICESRNINVNIEWEDSKRIYGDAWYQFLGECNATLGTESGANVFDFDGNLSRSIEEALQKDPNLTFEEAWETYLKPHEGKVLMNQISPKIFEAITCQTALILFEGSYSGVVKADIHFIPLKKDFSNIDDVLARIQDYNYLNELTARACDDIIKSGEYSYRRFIQGFDRILAERQRSRPNYRITSSVIGCQRDGEQEILMIPPHVVFSGAVYPETFDIENSSESSTRIQKWVSAGTGLSRHLFAAGILIWERVPLSRRQKIKPPLRTLAYRVLGLRFDSQESSKNK